MLHWFAIVTGLLLALITLPGTIELALLTIAGILPSRAVGPGADGRDVTIRKLAVVIPAHNEAQSITACVRSVAACAPPPGIAVAIVVVADNCSDATAPLSRAAGARVIERIDTTLRGKGFALHYAFTQLLGEDFDAMLIVDADSRLEANAIVAVAQKLAAGADGVQMPYLVLNADASIRVRLMNIALMAFHRLRPRGRERLGLSVGIFGNGFALSRATLEAVPYDAHSVVEDLEYHLRLVESGRRIGFAERTAVYGAMPTGGRGARTQRARWEGGRLRMITEHAPALARAVLRGRHLLLEPLLELLLLPLAFHVTLLIAVLIVPFEPTRLYASAALLLVTLHVVAGIIVGGGGRRDFIALLAAPFYIVWKLANLGAIVRTASGIAEWIRTARE
jgi:cellulose synthase/poly-beta-1,6-N-acetylglucosamine synthase-like glycosyltransferase